jgi:hypothetical protein
VILVLFDEDMFVRNNLLLLKKMDLLGDQLVFLSRNLYVKMKSKSIFEFGQWNQLQLIIMNAKQVTIKLQGN